MGNDKVKMVLFKDTHTQAMTLGELEDLGPRLEKANNIGLFLDYWSIIYRMIILFFFSLHMLTFNLLISNPSHGIGKQNYNRWF